MHICTHALERPHASMNVHPLQVKQTISDGWSELTREEQQEWGEVGVLGEGPCPVSWTVAGLEKAADEKAAAQKAQLEKVAAAKAQLEKAQQAGEARMRSLQKMLELQRTTSAAALEKAQSEVAALERAELERVESERLS